MTEKSLYERLGGVFAIAAVMDHFSDEVVKNRKVGQGSPNPQLNEWSTEEVAARLPGLKFMRTLWVCDVSGGPFDFSATKPGATELGLEEAHRELKISPDEFDEVAAELSSQPRPLRRAGAGEGRGPGGFRGAQGRGDRRSVGGRLARSSPGPAPAFVRLIGRVVRNQFLVQRASHALREQHDDDRENGDHDALDLPDECRVDAAAEWRQAVARGMHHRCEQRAATAADENPRVED